MTEVTKIDDMKQELEELRALVNTLLLSLIHI